MLPYHEIIIREDGRSKRERWRPYQIIIIIIILFVKAKWLMKDIFRFRTLLVFMLLHTMSNFSIIEFSLLVHLDHKFHSFILDAEEEKVSVFRVHPLLTFQTRLT